MNFNVRHFHESRSFRHAVLLALVRRRSRWPFVQVRIERNDCVSGQTMSFCEATNGLRERRHPDRLLEGLGGTVQTIGPRGRLVWIRGRGSRRAERAPGRFLRW